MNDHQTTLQFHRSTGCYLPSAKLESPVFLVVVCRCWGQVRPKLPSGTSWGRHLIHSSKVWPGCSFPPPPSTVSNTINPNWLITSLEGVEFREAWFCQRASKCHTHPKHIGVVIQPTAWQNFCVLIINWDGRFKTLKALFKISIHDTAPTQQYRTIQSLFQIH